MTIGSPDYTKSVKLYGLKADGTLKQLAVDDGGRIIMLPYGSIDVATLPNVVQADPARTMQGENGETLHTIAVDSEGRIIMIPYGTTTIDGAVDVTQTDPERTMQGENGGGLQTILVDALGRIISVMTGEYSGASKVLATDVGGRLIAVITDPENMWGVRTAIGNVELAVRLGSPVSWEQQGRVTLIDSFKEGFSKCDTSTSGAGGLVSICSDYARTGGYCAQLIAGSDVLQWANLHYQVYALTPAAFHGATLSVIVPTTDWDYFEMEFIVYTGTSCFTGKIRFNRTLAALEVDDDGVWREIADTGGGYVTAGRFNNVKLVVNSITGMYARLYLNSRSFNLSSYTMDSLTISTSPRIHLHIYNYGTAGKNPAMYVDDVILTTKEPSA